MKITLTTGSNTLTATLTDSAAARDFYQLLPLELTLSDYAGSEKIAYLPRKLDVSQEPAGVPAYVGDINYYAPWGNLAIFYRPHEKSHGLVHLGRLDGDFSVLLKDGKTKIRIDALAE